MLLHFAWLTFGALSAFGTAPRVNASVPAGTVAPSYESRQSVVAIIPAMVSVVGIMWQQSAKTKVDEKQTPALTDPKHPALPRRDELSKRLESRRDVLQKEGRCPHKKPCSKNGGPPSAVLPGKNPAPQR